MAVWDVIIVRSLNIGLPSRNVIPIYGLNAVCVVLNTTLYFHGLDAISYKLEGSESVELLQNEAV